MRGDEIWNILDQALPHGEWTRLQRVYELVAERAAFDAADEEPEANGSSQPRWKRNVRNVLQKKKSEGVVEWDGQANYRRA